MYRRFVLVRCSGDGRAERGWEANPMGDAGRVPLAKRSGAGHRLQCRRGHDHADMRVSAVAHMNRMIVGLRVGRGRIGPADLRSIGLGIVNVRHLCLESV